MALIEINNVSKTYDLGEIKVHALRSTTLSIERGEYVALIGASNLVDSPEGAEKMGMIIGGMSSALSTTMTPIICGSSKE